ncbi:MAG: hypothetical protein JRN58_06495 [Nitrososphaerota archaeon]|nr:hypothetical protein [Nitrososphaerota archaeon]MDG6978711.1 hypothetical protein [Nitrososphaerota archaeon]
MSEQNRAIIVRAATDASSGNYSNATFDVKFHFLDQDAGGSIEFKLFEVERDPKTSAVTKKTLVQGATVSGTLQKAEASGSGGSGQKPAPTAYLMTLTPSPTSRSETDATKPRVCFLFGSSANPFFVPLPDGRPRELQARVKLPPPRQAQGSSGGGSAPSQPQGGSDPAASDGPDVVGSPYFAVSGHFAVPFGVEATYDWYSGNRVAFYSNGSEDPKGAAGAFADIKKAIEGAQHFVLIADWSFQPYMKLAHDKDKPTVEDTVGALLIKQAKKNKDMVIAIHTWDHVAGAAPDPDNDFADLQLRDIARALDNNNPATESPENLLWRASGRTGIGYSHHQKMVVLDCESEEKGRREIKVFFGGLDLTKGRFDWWAHPIMPPPQQGGEKPKESTALDAESAGFVTRIPATGYGYTRFNTGGMAKHLGFSVMSESSYDDWYNAETKDNKALPRQPWHDIHAQITGATAWDMVREFVGRWNVDPASPAARGDHDEAAIRKVLDKFVLLLTKKKDGDDATHLFVQQWEKPKAKEGGFIGQVLRSIERVHWGQPAYGNWWPTQLEVVGASPKEFDWVISNDKFERSIQDAYVRAISGAQRFVYIESQYFIGAGIWVTGLNNMVPKTIVKRVLQMIEKKKPFHVYVVIPMYPEGNPHDGALQVVREYEASTMEFITTNIQAACEALGKKDPSFKGTYQDYVSFYFPVRWDRRNTVDLSGKREARVSANQRYMIYVHSKLMIVDDEFAIIGSANLNERSLAGDRDTEVCIAMTAQDDAARKSLQDFRLELWSQHLGNAKAKAAKKDSWKAPEKTDCVSELRTRATTNYVAMRTNTFADANGFLCKFPLDWERGKVFGWNTKIFEDKNYKGVDWLVLPDAENEGTHWLDNTAWRWDCPSAARSLLGRILRRTDIPE